MLAVTLVAQTAPGPPITIAQHYRELAAARSDSPAARAEACALHFVLAVAVADGRHAERVLDPIGYQPLPFGKELPADPPKPIRSEALIMWINALPESSANRAPAEAFRLVDRDGTRRYFPAIARWMLPDDHVLLIEPAADVRNWVHRKACLVVRLRGRDATVVGGNLLAALDRTAEAGTGTVPGGPTDEE